jgi:hypothetical protein
MLFTRGFSLTNFVIGSSALCFQIFVLYPWHEKLDDEFTELKKEHARLLEETRERHRHELQGIREQLELINERNKRSGKFWWAESASEPRKGAVSMIFIPVMVLGLTEKYAT